MSTPLALALINGLRSGAASGRLRSVHNPVADEVVADVAKVQIQVEDAVARGASVLAGGSLVQIAPGAPDRFFAPTILGGMDDTMLIYSEETFGPAAPLIRFETESEAIRMANDSPYDLAAYFFTSDASRLFRVAEALEYGIVGANDALPSTPQAPFGGMKESGLGREGGHWGLDLFLETKYVSVGGG